MTNETTQTVVGLGEALWDCFADARRPGGAPANVAFHAQQLGHRGVICSRVGDDDPGRELVQYFKNRGLTTDHIQQDPDHPTGTVTVDTRDPNHPEYIIHENVAWDHIGIDVAAEQLMRSAAAVCFGTLAQRHSDSRSAIAQALAMARDALIVYDVNLRQQWRHRDWINASLHAANIVKLNAEEVRLIGAQLDIDGRDPEAFAHNVLPRYAVDLVCITRGGKGCLLIAPDEVVDIPGKPIQVVDAVGAGDAFTAALISAKLHGWPLPRCGAFANAVGGLVAQRSGAMPDIASELADLRSRAVRDELN